MLGGAIVLLQLVDGYLRKVIFKLKDVLNGRPTEGIDALGIVPHDTDVLRAVIVQHEVLEDLVLQEVGILKLVDKDVRKQALILLAHLLRILIQQFEHLQQQVVKVHRSRAETAIDIPRVDLLGHGPLLLIVVLQQFEVLGIELRGDQVAFCR